ncbi:MAG: hypothetical protein KJP12_00235, partial [Acidimicrobiia bacterium]|nr:hypothetical protein [Acidimicrobiia bacterium]
MRAHVSRAHIFAVVLATTAALVLVPSPALATEYSCDLAGLEQAINDTGGPHTFDCAGPSTIQTTGNYLVINQVVELDGEGLLTIEIQPDPFSRLFLVGGPAAELILHNLAITGGYVGNDAGGAIIVGGSAQAHLHNVDIHDNSAGEGGAVAVQGGAFLRVFESSLHDNTAGDGGAVALSEGSEALIQASTVSSNVAMGNPVTDRRGNGGGIWAVENSTTRLEGSVVNANSAAWHGGGIFVHSSDLSMFDTAISDNTANKSGGGLYGGNVSTVDVTASDISSNGSRNGGGIYTWDSQLVVDVSSITDNHALIWDGGGVQMTAELGVASATITETY